jgi:Flp pilus assembly protein TadG
MYNLGVYSAQTTHTRRKSKPLMKRSAKSGAAAVEFALVAPLFLALLGGVIAYGGYIWTAHTVQQLANNAARAAVAGLTDAERKAFAEECVDADVAALAGFMDDHVNVATQRRGRAFTVSVEYDGASNPFLAFGALVPLPEPRITRRASALVGGY